MPGRSGQHAKPRLSVKLPVTEAEAERWRAIAADEGVTLAQWLTEAARAYVAACGADKKKPRLQP